MVVGTTSRDATTSGRVGRSCDFVTVDLEVGYVVATFGDGEAVVCVGGDYSSVLGPVDEGVACISSCHQVASGAVCVGAVTRYAATDARVGRSGDVVIVHAEVGYVCGFLCNSEAEAQVGGNDRSVLGPVDESMAGIGRDRQGAACAVVVVACSGDSTSTSRVAGSGNLVAVEAEVGYVVATLGDGEAVVGSGGDHSSVLGPVDEGISRVGSGDQVAGCAVVVGSTSCNGTTSGRIGRCGDFVTVDLEIGDESRALGDGEGIARVGRNHGSVLCPIEEGIAFIGGCYQGDRSAVSISTRAGNSTSLCRIGRSRDFVTVDLEVGYVVATFGDGEAVVCVGGDYSSVLGPVDEGVARIGCDRQGAACTVVVVACSGDSTSTRRVAGSGNIVIVKAEVGYVVTTLGDGETIVGSGGDHSSVLGPVSEGVASIGRGDQVAGRAVVVVTTASYRAASSRVGRSGDFVTVDLEIGDESRAFGDGEGIARVGRNHGSILRPIEEGIAFIGGCYQGDRSAVSISTRAGNSTTLCRIGRSRDFISVDTEVGYVCGLLCNGEIEALGGGNHSTVFRPVGKGIARIGCDRQSAACAVVVVACSSDSACANRVAGSGNIVVVEVEVSYVVAALGDGETVVGTG